MTMAEMTMISMAVMAATQQSRSFLEAAAGRKDLYLEEGPLEEGTLEIGTLGIGTLEKADVIYLPDYSSLDFRQVRRIAAVCAWFGGRRCVGVGRFLR